MSVKNEPWTIEYSGDQKRCFVGPFEIDNDDVSQKQSLKLAKLTAQLPVLFPDTFGKIDLQDFSEEESD